MTDRARFLAAGLALGAVAGRPASGQDLPTLRIAGPPQEGFKTTYYGVQSGIFKRLGVNVEIVQVNNGAAALAALAGGSVDVALTSTVPFFQGFARGVPFAIVAPGQLYEAEHPTAQLFARKDSPAQRGADLNGKTICVQSIRDLNWAATLNWIDATGGDSKTVKVIELPLASVIPALVDGRVDAGTLTAPFLEQGLANDALRAVARPFDVIAKRFEVGVYISTKGIVEAKREAMVRLARGMHDAAAYVNGHPVETVDLIAGFSGVDRAVIAKAPRTRDPDAIDPKDIQPVLDLAYKYKLIDRPLTVAELVAPTALVLR